MTAPTQTPRPRARVLRYSPAGPDDPSRQLLKDLERALGQIQLHESEAYKVRAFHRRSFLEDLEAKDLERTKADIAALDAATARHEAIRQEAEFELQRHIREVEDAELRRREEEARLAREKAAREQAERERKEREEAERKAKIEREMAAAAAAKKAAEEKARAEAEAAKRKQQEEAAAKAKAQTEKEAAERMREEKVAADQRVAQEAAKRESIPSSQTLPGGALSPELGSLHNRYLEIHKKLKTFRKEFIANVKANKELKSHVGDMRRGMKTSVGQLTDDKATNKKAHERVKTAINSSLTSIQSPPIMISTFLPTSLADPSTTIPSLTLYLLSIFSKALISAFAGECAVNPKAAEPIGTLAAQIFSMPDLQFPLPANPSLFSSDDINNNGTPPQNQSRQSTSLISILLCKFHKCAPHLFGISVPLTSNAAKIAMGWREEYLSDQTTKSLVPVARQLDRLSGLGAGFSSISLRNFSRSQKLHNPYPPRHFWSAVACLLNYPPNTIDVSHVVLMKGMLEVGWERVVAFWGSAGVALLREAGVYWIRRLPVQVSDSAPAKGLSVMVEGWEREGKFTLVID